MANRKRSRAKSANPAVVIIDDDASMEVLAENLNYRGIAAKRVGSVQQALDDIRLILKASLVILDILIPSPQELNKPGGMRVFQEIRRKNKTIPIIAFSGTNDHDLINTIRSDHNSKFVSKWEVGSLSEFIGSIQESMNLPAQRPLPTAFIVHGRDEVAKLQLKNYLQNTIKLPQPIILHEQPNLGRTLLEKFEAYSAQSQLVFVLLTPDDQASDGTNSNKEKRRARQNVIFELGYFLGKLGRDSGRVLLLHKGPLELPSDISGLVYIDISNGIEPAGEQIRNELKPFFI